MNKWTITIYPTLKVPTGAIKNSTTSKLCVPYTYTFYFEKHMVYLYICIESMNKFFIQRK